MVATVTLNTGYTMPTLGLGTFSTVSVPKDELFEIFFEAIKIGYRQFDTATLYGTEKPIGKAIKKAIEQKIVSSREEFFITSKLWGTDAYSDHVLPALKNSLENLGVEYLDLFLIHWPVILKKVDVITFPVEEDDILPYYDPRPTWEAMEECKRLGLVHSIGVSNFSSKKLSDLLAFATIPPAVNQVEMNPLWNQNKLRDFCKEKGIQISAYQPLSSNGGIYGSPDVVSCPTIREIAQSKKKTVPQICLRWLLEQGVTIVVKSFNEGRLKENFQIFGWELSEEDKNEIDSLPQKKGYPGDMYLSRNGPYRTLEELWDGEI